ncbi:glycosyltransferase family 2 protein [Streptomyces sp. NPDC004539]|uniref:glycosyltransferase family 2 protein n=1 Tax=Streptomyces sp. NPDC004539 TaxID=3154280 RepID=UPI0033A77A10
MTAPPEPRVRGNDHGTLTPPPLGGWQPRLTASVVVPAHGGQDALDLTLAALAAQSYPAHLTEVVVVDDGSSPPIRLPELAPDHTRLISSAPGGWGRSHAVRSGSEAADGDVIVWIDADTLAFREHLEAQLRWHHLARYLVVLGSRRVVDFVPGDLTAAEVHAAVTEGAEDRLYTTEASRPNHWIETVYKATDDLRRAGASVGTTLVGSTASAHRDLLRAAGDSDPRLILGEDSELGYRLSQAGGVFVPEHDARSWHLGAPTIERDQRRLLGHIRPHLTDRIPTMRLGRTARRQWLVPYVDVVVDTTGASHDAVRASVDAVLEGSLPDTRVTLVGAWDTLTDGRRKVLADPLADLRLIRAEYAHEGRVRFVTDAGDTSFPAPFRLHCAPGWRLAPEGLAGLVREADAEGLGLVELTDGERVARLERTSAVRRAHFLAGPGDDPDTLIGEVSGTLEADAGRWGSSLAPDDDGQVSVDGLLAMLEEQGMSRPRAAGPAESAER